MVLPCYQITEPDTLVRDTHLPSADDPYFYGWREVLVDVNGEKEWIQQPLTFDDVMHPQLGDFIVQTINHHQTSTYLYNALVSYLAHEPDTVVTSDAPIDWELPGIKAMGPDIAVIHGVQQRFDDTTFYVKQSRGHVDLVVEVTSPSTWDADVEEARTTKPNKFQKYAWVGVPDYVIIDEVQQYEGEAPPISAYRLGAGGRYERIAPDARGWFWIDSVALWIGPYQDTIAWYTPDGTRLRSHVEEVEACLIAEEQARYEAEARQRETKARHIAEEKAHYEAEARQRAEEQARQAEEARQREADARQRAEEQAHYEAEARQRAEEQARQAENRIRELEALLRKAGMEKGK